MIIAVRVGSESSTGEEQVGVLGAGRARVARHHGLERVAVLRAQVEVHVERRAAEAELHAQLLELRHQSDQLLEQRVRLLARRAPFRLELLRTCSSALVAFAFAFDYTTPH